MVFLGTKFVSNLSERLKDFGLIEAMIYLTSVEYKNLEKLSFNYSLASSEQENETLNLDQLQLCFFTLPIGIAIAIFGFIYELLTNLH